jgi:large repetitive protein
VRVTDNLGSQATKAFSIVVSSGPTITTTSLPDAEVGRLYSQQLQAGGGTGQITWTISSGTTLPANLTLSSSGAITGSPSTAGTASFTVRATDAAQATATKDLSIIVNLPAPGVLQFGSPTYSVDENGGAATITVLRTGGSSGPVTAVLSTGGGSASLGVDYTFTLQSVTFMDGDTTPKQVPISITDDAFGEGAETVGLALSNSGGGALLGPRSNATLTIVDNETGLSGGSSGGGGGGGGGCAVDAAARDMSLAALLLLALSVRGWRHRRSVRRAHD